MGRGRQRALAAAIILASGSLASLRGAAAQEIAKDEILRQLAPRSLTRSLAPAQTRRIEVVPGQQDQVLAEVKGLPSINIRVLFDYDSDVLGPAGQSALKPLGEALQDSRLSSSRILIGGHSDARGMDDYNQDLSERRARNVSEYLARQFGIGKERLSSMGFGRRKLAVPADPANAANRRVEIVNLGN